MVSPNIMLAPCERSLSIGLLVFFSERSPDACQINGNEAENIMQANILPFYTPRPPDGVDRSKQILKKVIMHIKLKTKMCRTLCKFDFYNAHPCPFGFGKQVRH